MLTEDEKLLNDYFSWYQEGFYTKSEAANRVKILLAKSNELNGLWSMVPGWVRLIIWDSIKDSNYGDQVMDLSRRTIQTVDPSMVDLKNWILSSGVV